RPTRKRKLNVPDRSSRVRPRRVRLLLNRRIGTRTGIDECLTVVAGGDGGRAEKEVLSRKACLGDTRSPSRASRQSAGRSSNRLCHVFLQSDRIADATVELAPPHR